MYDIKSIESGEKKHENILNNYYQKNSSYTSISSLTSPFSTVSSATSSLSSISSTILSSSTISPTFAVNNPCSAISAVTTATTNNSMLLRRRRIFQRQACLLSVMAAFSLGLALGVFIPMIGMSAAFTSTDFLTTDRNNKTATIINNNQQNTLANTDSQQQQQNGSIEPKHPPSNFPTIYETDSNQNNKNNNNNNRHHIPHQMVTDTYSVSFVKDKELPAENSYQQNSIHLRQDKKSDSISKLDSNIKHNVKEFRLQQRSSNDHLYGKGSEKDSLMSKLPLALTKERIEVEFIPIESKISSKMQSYLEGIIKDGIYWGDLIERSLPRGYSNQDAEHWNTYVRNAVITHLEVGCGRMQNRMVIFSDGTKACARYRQNTDQIQGELFSFYLGQLLNLTNLAPSAASVIDLETETWSNAIQDITLAQWKSFRPVVLTKWLPNLEPAGIPTPFQPLERHLNKFDVWNITLGIDHENKIHQQQNQQQQQQQQQQYQKGLLERLGAAIIDDQSQRSADTFNIGGVDDVIAPDVSSSSNGQDIKISGINNGNGNVASDISDSVAIAISNDYNHDHDDDHSLTSHKHHHYHHQQQQQQHHYQQNNHLNKQPISNNDDGLNVGNKYDKDRLINSTILNHLIELAQWSDLIIFDYLIANLDRVVNNLYNYQWNADIMAAPAHNLAKQTNSKLLVFLDNESGLLHGYRLLKKYEAYHGLLLDNLCVFRKTTIQSLQSLRDYGVGHQLQQLFEKLTSHQIRDVLPSLPDKSIKILIDRIDRVLGQVHKCRDLFSDR